MSIVSNPLERANVASDLTFGKNVEFLNCSYSGQLTDGFRQGLGQSVAEKDEFTYTGEYHNNARHGYGVLVNKLKNSYCGRFQNGSPHEGGIVTTLSGERYEVEYNQGSLIFSQKMDSNVKGNIKLAALADKAWEKEKEVQKIISEGGVTQKMPKVLSQSPSPMSQSPLKSRPQTAVSGVSGGESPSIEMFGDDEEEPNARPETRASAKNQFSQAEEVHYADPSELCILPAQIADRGDYHWDELQSSEAAKFLTAYGSEGTFLVRTRPMTNNETALAALLGGTVHHFKFEISGGMYMMGGVKKKTIPLLIAYFFKHSIYKRSCLREPLPPYIDKIRDLEAIGHSTAASTKAFKATKSYDMKTLQQYIKDKGLQ